MIGQTTKKIAVKDQDEIFISKEIGAEAENIEVSFDENGQITTVSEKGEGGLTLPLNETLKDFCYNIEDEESNELNNDDFIPMSTSISTKKKISWSNIITKIKTAFGINTEIGDNKFLKQNGQWDEPINTWKANSATSEGYVQKAGINQKNKVWKTDESGNPAWRDADHIPFRMVDTLNANSLTEDGIWGVKNSITSIPAAPISTGGILWYVKSVSTPYQMYVPDNEVRNIYKRRFLNGTWENWNAIDTNTWRGIQNNLTSDATDQSLSAAMGKSLANGNARDNTKIGKNENSTITGIINKAGGSISWIKGRDTAITRMNSYKGTSAAPSYSAILSDKTLNGSWELGTYDNNNLYLTYCTDANYNSNNNVTSGQYIFKPNINADLSRAIKNISVNGRTITATHFDNTTSTIDTQDSNTTYSAGNNITLSGTTFSLTSANVAGALGFTPLNKSVWVQNSASSAGYVPKGSGNANKVWKTDGNGNPAWRDDANTTYSAGAGLQLSNGTFSLQNHASTATTYGVGTANNYGHVKLTDKYDDISVTGSGIAASSKAVYNCYSYSSNAISELRQAKAPNNHASSATTYGVGTSSNYGHLKISDSPTTSQTAATGIAASGKALRIAYDDLLNRVTSVSNDLGTLGKLAMPKSGGTFTGSIVVSVANGTAHISIGNDKKDSTQSGGYLRLYNKGTGFYSQFRHDASALTNNWAIVIPNKSGTMQVGSSSSRRIKTNIREMTEERAKKLLDVEIVNFDYIEPYEGGLKDQSGVIAEDAIKIIPEAVTIPKDYDETKPIDKDNRSPEVDYRQYVPYLIKMVQMQQKEIEELKVKIK